MSLATVRRLRTTGTVLIGFGVVGLIVGGIAFTTVLPSPWRELGEACFLGGWIPLLIGYVLTKIADRLTATAHRARG